MPLKSYAHWILNLAEAYFNMPVNQPYPALYLKTNYLSMSG